MRLCLPLLIVFLPACASMPAVAPTELPAGPQSIVVVADGAGDYRACSESLRETAEADHRPFEVITFVWSHGYLHNWADQTDYPHARHRGDQLAELIRRRRERSSDGPIILVGHSAGAAVVLAAAEALPPNSIDRIVLLSPSLSDGYDLRPALAASRDGIDAFISDRDWLWLGVVVDILGTADDPHADRASGRYGFVPQRDGDNLYAKLRLHRWRPEEKILGNDGGHFGGYQPDFLRNVVFPLFDKRDQ